MLRLKKRITELEAELNKLKAELDNQEYCLNVLITKPPFEEMYWFIRHNGEVDFQINTNTERDDAVFENNIVFKDQISAETYKELRQDMKRLSKEFEIDERNYYLYYNHVNKKVETDVFTRWEENNYHFTEENAQYILDKYGQEVLKNYILYCK